MQDTGRNSNKDSNMDNDMNNNENNNANNNVNEQPPFDDKRLREMYDITDGAKGPQAVNVEVVK